MKIPIIVVNACMISIFMGYLAGRSFSVILKTNGVNLVPDFIGLYYPNFTFPGDDWMKLAALYWDKLGRILPPVYKPHDSDTVQRLQGELDFTKDLVPSFGDTYEVSKMFLVMLEQYREQLLAHYSVLQQTSNLAYIYSNVKMSYELSHCLRDMGFAVDRLDSRRENFNVIGMHPRLAFVYMEALADHMASHRQLHPVTNNERHHVTMGGYTLERLVQALLEDEVKPHLVGNTPTSEEVARLIAEIAFQSILPKNITSIPVEKIIQLRRKHRTELTAFQTYIHDFTTRLDTIQQIDDPRALEAHLRTAYEREIEPQLNELKKGMRSLAIETVTGVFNVKVALPPLFASAGAALHLAPISPGVAGAVAVACSVLPVYQKKRAEIHERVHTSPEAYLLYAQEGLQPTNVVSQVVRATRHMLLGA